VNTETTVIKSSNTIYINPYGKNSPEQISLGEEEFTKAPSSLHLTLRGWKIHLADIALLKTAYLWCFSVLGYAFVVNANLNPIRAQIQNPSEKIFSDRFYFEQNYPDEMLGVNIVTYPKELQSFLVVFDTVKHEHKKRYGVYLPGFPDSAMNIYNFMRKNDGKKIDINCKHIDEFDFNKEPLRAVDLWHEFCK
jgi:hypothetical protein